MSKPVLLVIDLQQCLVDPPPDDGPRSTPALADNVRTILQHWRAHAYPLIHVHHHAAHPADPLHAAHATTSAAAHACAAPLPTEPVRYKSCGSAFASAHDGTTLQQDLERWRAPDGAWPPVVLVGMDGAQCVNSSARSAADLGLEATVVADACASFGMSAGRPGRAWSAPETHEVAMAMLESYARVVTTEELLEGLK